MDSRRIRYLILTAILTGLGLLSILKSPNPQEAQPRSLGVQVLKVIDGDTVEITGGRLVRYIGINAPEMGMPFYRESTLRNKELVENKKVRIEVCQDEPRDKHGRVLAWVYVDNVLINAELLKDGYARLFIIPPCGVKRADEFKRYQDEVRKRKVGIWTNWEGDIVPADQAHRFSGRTRWVRGKVVDTYDSGKAVFLNFGEDHKKDFTVVIFNKNLIYFEKAGINPGSFYKGKRVLVYGHIKEYNGPEVVVETPWEIEIQ
ncbi:MAG: thermonuclease family protein [Deltaproteobacteria bacterium]|nr:thermonuclease family protein [Deltaproteobacteria bacterium]